MTPTSMTRDAIAARIARDELQHLARRMFDAANAPDSSARCSEHRDVTRALGCLLAGMDELLAEHKAGRVAVPATVAGVVAGLVLGVGKLLGL